MPHPVGCAPPTVAVVKVTTDWLSHLAVHSAHCLKTVGIPGLINSVRGEPDIHSAVGTLPHEAAPLLDQMRPKESPLKIDGPPLTPKNYLRLLRMGPTTLVTEIPHFYVRR